MKRAGAKNSLDVSQAVEEVDLKILADRTISNIITKEGALCKTFKVCDFTLPYAYDLHVRGYPYYYGGYAEHLRQFVFGLDDLGKYSILLTPIDSPKNVDPTVLGRINTFIKNPSFDINNSVFIGIAGPGWFQDDKKFIPQDNRYKIGWTMIETRMPQKRIIEWLSNLDEVWAPTDVDVKRFNGLDNVIKMRLGYDHKKYNAFVKPVNMPSVNRRFVFGVLGSWNWRKGVRHIVRAFCRQYTARDPVTLLLVCKYGNRPFDETVGFCGKEPRKKEDDTWNMAWELEAILEELDIPRRVLPHIAVLDVPIHEDVLPHVMETFDCLVGFSKGESTWLPGLQAMAMGKPVIQLISECSGFTEYLDYSPLVCRDVNYEIAKEEDYLGTSGYYDGEELAIGNEDELKDKMDYVYENSKLKSNIVTDIIVKGLEIVKDWTWEKSIEAAHKRLEQVFRDYRNNSHKERLGKC